MCKRHLRTTAIRTGFSVLELLVVIVIIGILIALAMPAIQRARAVARRAQCVNNLRNITFALTQYDTYSERLPASGYYLDQGGVTRPLHSWALEVLNFLDQGNLAQQWNRSKGIGGTENQPLSREYIPVFVCPDDISDTGLGDLSYAVNGGWGYTIRTSTGVRDCARDWHGNQFDFNGDGQSCTGVAETDELDMTLFKRLGLFFLENQQGGPTQRHYAIADIKDGTSQTFLVTENIRAGVDPATPLTSFANPDPHRSAFYVGSPCAAGACIDGQIDYSQCNAGPSRINSGLERAEGKSPVPNSMHDGGVNMAYADGHVSFLVENVDGAVYAALASPNGFLLDETPLQQVIPSGQF